MQCRKLFAVIDDLNEQYQQIWEEICNIESPTACKEGVDAVGRYLCTLAEKQGWQIEICSQPIAGDAICITMNPDGKRPQVSFSGHLDTVHPVGSCGTPAARRDETRLYGPGAMDCKGGVVAAVMAMEALHKCGFQKRPVRLILQTDEETSSITSNKQTIAYMMEKAKGSVAFLNLEGIKGNSTVLTRKGILRCCFHVKGRAVHSARCATGANAIAEAAYKIIELEKMKDAGGLTCNCGVIRGGTVPNVVADECSFYADIRFRDREQQENAMQILRTVADTNHVDGCSCELEIVSSRPAMPKSEINEKLLEEVNGIFVRNHLPQLEAKSRLSGSDAAYITEAGIPCLDSIGVSGGNIHSVHEFADLHSLAECAKRLAAIAYCI